MQKDSAQGKISLKVVGVYFFWLTLVVKIVNINIASSVNQSTKQLWSTSNCLYLARNWSLHLTINILGNSKPNWSWQYLTVSITLMFNSFIKNLFMTKSSDRISETLSGHTSRPYNNTGKHLLLIRCKVNSSDAILPISPKIAFVDL